MRKTNEPKKSANGAAAKVVHIIRTELLVLWITDCEPEVAGIFSHEL
jgi:hypothetical protein